MENLLTSDTVKMDFPRTDGLRMCVPRLPVLTTYIDKSYTDVKLGPSLARNVVFRPWTEFDKLVEEVKSRIDSFPSFLIDDAWKSLEKVRKHLDPCSVHMDMVKRKKEEFFLQDTMSQQPRAALRVEENSCSSHAGSHSVAAVTSVKETEKRGVAVYTSSNSCIGINTIVFEIVEDLLRSLRRCKDIFVVSELLVNSEIARAYDELSPLLSGGPSDFCTLSPDRALTRTTTRPASSLPICAFELKGPYQFFWNVDNPIFTGVASKKRRVSKPEGIGSALKKNDASTRKGDPTEYVSRIARNEKAKNYSSNFMADFYTDVFKLHAGTEKKGGSSKNLFLRVAQALAQALLTDSGCCVLYNHDEAVVFQICEPESTSKNERHDAASSGDVGKTHGCEETEKEEERKTKQTIPVLVSRLFPCDEEPGNICALLAAANHACDSVLGDETKKLKVRASFQKATRDFKSKLEEKHKGKKGNRKQGDDSTSEKKDSSTPLDSRATNEGKQAVLGGFREFSFDEFHHPFEMRFPIRTTTSTSSTHSTGSVASVVFADRNTDDNPSFTKTLAKIVRTNVGVIGHGATSVIIGGAFEGRAVAVKSWNGVDKQGLKCLLNEIQIYRVLDQQHSEALGTAIPRIRLSRMIPAEDPILVVDRVGTSILRRYDGGLVFHENGPESCLDLVDIQSIFQAASRSLRVLHRSSVLHGDIALRNLRVAHDGDSGGDWRAWWIDLGMAKMGASSLMEFEIELEQCASLLPEAESNLAITTE